MTLVGMLSPGTPRFLGPLRAVTRPGGRGCVWVWVVWVWVAAVTAPAQERPPWALGGHFRESSPHQGDRALEVSRPLEAPCLRLGLLGGTGQGSQRDGSMTMGPGRGHRAPASAGPAGVERPGPRAADPHPLPPAVVGEAWGDAETRPPPPQPCPGLLHTRHMHTTPAHSTCRLTRAPCTRAHTALVPGNLGAPAVRSEARGSPTQGQPSARHAGRDTQEPGPGNAGGGLGRRCPPLSGPSRLLTPPVLGCAVCSPSPHVSGTQPGDSVGQLDHRGCTPAGAQQGPR